MLIMLLIFGVSSLATFLLFFLVLSRHKPYKTFGIVSFVICILAFTCVAIVGAIFSEEPILNVKPNKTYSEPEIAFSTSYQLTAIDDIPHYLIQEDGEYRYLIASSDDANKKVLKVDASQCEIELSSEKSSLVIERLETEYRSEWLFIYDHSTETKVKYKFTIPNEESVLNLDDL